MINYVELRELLNYATKNVEFYSKHISPEIDAIQSDQDTLAIFKTIPIITKQDIKSDYYQFISQELRQYDLRDVLNIKKNFKKEYDYNFSDINIKVEYTSGTSGTPFISLKSLNERLALGRNLWKLRNTIYPAKPHDFFYFIHTFRENLYPYPFSEPKTEPEKIIKELDFLSKNKCSWWHINTYILDYYYQYISKHPYRFEALKVIENNGSFISEEEKKKYSEGFSCFIANNYGCREVWAIAYDCRNGYLHINESSLLFELVDDNDNLIDEPNKIGNVVVTSLKQKIMPFIRYKLSDIAYYIDGDCSCGNKSRRIFVLPGRHMIAGTQIYGNRCFKDIISYLNLQFNLTRFNSISVSQNDYTHFTVNIKGNMEDKETMEKCFIDAANFVMRSPNWEFKFTYDETLEPKSIFTVNMKI